MQIEKMGELFDFFFGGPVYKFLDIQPCCQLRDSIGQNSAMIGTGSLLGSTCKGIFDRRSSIYTVPVKRVANSGQKQQRFPIPSTRRFWASARHLYLGCCTKPHAIMTLAVGTATSKFRHTSYGLQYTPCRHDNIRNFGIVFFISAELFLQIVSCLFCAYFIIKLHRHCSQLGVLVLDKSVGWTFGILISSELFWITTISIYFMTIPNSPMFRAPNIVVTT